MPKVTVIDNSPVIKNEFQQALARTAEAIGLQAEANAKKEITKVVYDTPSKGYKRTGNLRNSITHATDGESAYVGTNVEYAPYVELGTSKMKTARPFIRPAVEKYVDQYKEIAKKELRS